MVQSLRTALALSFACLALPAQTTTPCTGLCQQQVQCPVGSSTTVTGTVYAPNGTDPIPNVTVYIPNATVDPLPTGVTCAPAGQVPSGSPLVGAFTAADGTFTLNNVPVGMNIPVVILAGKWRRQFMIPGTTACSNTVFNARFARNQSEGDIPKFAVATGNADSVECVLRKVGIDDSEFTNPAGSGRIQLFQSVGGAGARIDLNTPSATSLLGSSSTLNSYDILMLPCEGGFYSQPADQLSNIVSYANSGGKIYGSHFAYEWLANNPPFDSVVNWNGNSTSYGGSTLAATVDPSFPGAATLSKWLQTVGASTSTGKIDVSVVRKDFDSIKPLTQSWLTLDQTGGTVQFTFPTPVGQSSGQCGRVLFNEYHVENPPSAPKDKLYPSECSSGPMTAQEKLLEYSLFDLANNGGPATLTPTALDFGTQFVGFATLPQSFTIKNNSVFTSTLGAFSASGDFKVTGNTCSSVPANGTCTIQVIFQPTNVGQRTGSLTLNFGGTDLAASLTGTGISPVAFSNNSVDFGSVDVGASLRKTISLINIAPGTITVPALSTTGDYSVSTACPKSLAQGASCPVTITFQPTATGQRTGSLSAPGTSTTLTGNGVDFALSTSPSSGSVIAGLPKTFFVTATSIAGFAAPVSLTCSTNAPGSTCSISNGAFTLSSAVTTPVALTTTSQYTVVGYGVWSNLLLGGFSLTAPLLLFRRRYTGRRLLAVGALLLAAGGMMAGLSGCSGKLPDQNIGYTPAGAYSFTITGTDGFLVRTATYQLTVAAK